MGRDLPFASLYSTRENFPPLTFSHAGSIARMAFRDDREIFPCDTFSHYGSIADATKMPELPRQYMTSKHKHLIDLIKTKYKC